jgi:predicted aminopeptidase
VDGHYERYADIHRRFVVWNVHAAPEFSLEAKTWWYPVVGSLKYQGWFSEAAARDHAAALRRQGFDEFVGGVEAYSTLGWFHDPVLNTWISDPDSDLAELLFHELTHQRLFVAGDTDFNEALATAVSEVATRRWLAAARDDAAVREYEAELRRKDQFIALVKGTRCELTNLFALHANRPDGTVEARKLTAEEAAELRSAKQAIMQRLHDDYGRLKQDWGGAGEFDGWFQQPLNNAHLNDLETYYRLVPAFHLLLTEQGDDLEQFFAAVKKLGRESKEARHAELEARLSAPRGQLQTDPRP